MCPGAAAPRAPRARRAPRPPRPTAPQSPEPEPPALPAAWTVRTRGPASRARTGPPPERGSPCTWLGRGPTRRLHSSVRRTPRAWRAKNSPHLASAHGARRGLCPGCPLAAARAPAQAAPWAGRPPGRRTPRSRRTSAQLRRACPASNGWTPGSQRYSARPAGPPRCHSGAASEPRHREIGPRESGPAAPVSQQGCCSPRYGGT
mmetsp:Transcript_57797/g.164216  ORF Transcript_57797/g.164216 Transcript_57797/m.164216 type:complete len:204 (+) Transcript_57797:421-1032(+)